VSSISTIPAALFAIALATGVVVLGLGLLALARIPEGRHRRAWQLWCAALGLDVAATAIGMAHQLAGIGIPPGVVESIVALAAAVATMGVVARLPAHAVAASHLVLDQVPLVLTVVAVASVTYGGVVDDSPGHIAIHLVEPAAFTVLAALCLEGIHYVGGLKAPRSAKLLTLGFLFTAVAGISPAFVADPAALALPRITVWVAGLVAIGAGAAMRARHPGEAREYAPRLDPISGWSWGAALGVVVLFLLVLFHRGPEDDFRFVAAVLALGAFAARSTMARRQGTRLMADLHSADMRYRTLVEQIPLAIYTTGLDSTGTAKYVSPAIEQLLGYTQEEVEGDADWFPSVLHPDDRRVLDALGEWYEMRSGDSWEEEFRVVAKNGGVRWIRDRAVIIRDESGATATRSRA